MALSCQCKPHCNMCLLLAAIALQLLSIVRRKVTPPFVLVPNKESSKIGQTTLWGTVQGMAGHCMSCHEEMRNSSVQECVHCGGGEALRTGFAAWSGG